MPPLDAESRVLEKLEVENKVFTNVTSMKRLNRQLFDVAPQRHYFFTNHSFQGKVL